MARPRGTAYPYVTKKCFDRGMALMSKRVNKLLRRNLSLTKTLQQEVCNRKNYLEQKIKKRGGYYTYVKELKQLQSWKATFTKKFNGVHLFGNNHNNIPKYVVALTNTERHRLMHLIGTDRWPSQSWSLIKARRARERRAK